MDVAADVLLARPAARCARFGPGRHASARLSRWPVACGVSFLESPWDEWIALDPSTAEVDVLPSVRPARVFRSDVVPPNFAARVGRYSFGAGSPFTAGTWRAAAAGAGCAIDVARAVSTAGGARAPGWR